MLLDNLVRSDLHVKKSLYCHYSFLSSGYLTIKTTNLSLLPNLLPLWLEAVQRFGALKGGWLTIKRISKMPSISSWWNGSSSGKKGTISINL